MTETGCMDVFLTYKYEKRLHEFYEVIEDTTQTALDFWRELESDPVEMSNLIHLSSKISQSYNLA